ncbi:unnamed protein product [Strongylus vulgaris]|uniref:Uncharacterized protein n=1 Tax=Strongylus vulgaris TaxID=40348 RepID=A0A3P7LMB0_STRVU|nr:unnamed protein product [Strongylus vulgaris]
MHMFIGLIKITCHRGRTEYEAVHKDGARLSRRATATFERRPSQRYGPRQSHAQQRKSDPSREAPVTTKPRSSSVAVAEQLVSHLTVGDELNHPKAATIVTAPPTPVVTTPVAASRITQPSLYTNPFSIDNKITPTTPAQPQPLPTTALPSQHITMIPISAVKEKSSSPMEEKFCSFSDASSEQPTSRSSSRIPKYVLTSMEKEQVNESASKVSSPTAVSPTSAKPTNPADLVTDLENEQVNESASKVSSPTAASPSAKPTNPANLVTDLENVSPTSLPPSNTKLKPNTGIPKPSKLRPPSTRYKPADTNIHQEEPRISRIPKMSDGSSLRATNNGLRSTPR